MEVLWRNDSRLYPALGVPVEFRILGPVSLRADGHVLPVGEPRQQLVLAVLLFEAGRTVSVDTLVSRVWGDSPPQRVRRSLQAHLTRIRRVLERAEPGSARLIRDPGGYRVDVRPEQVDVFRFRSTVRDGTADNVALAAALGLWRGEPLAGLSGEWAERTRRTLGQEHLAAVVAWAAAEIRAGQAPVTLVRLTELVAEHPLHEGAAAVLMRALYAVGRAADALAEHERVRVALRDELGADPGPELAAVHEAVLRHDLPSRDPSAVPAQLPAAVTAFTGRAGELAELDRLAARAGGEPVIACLTGTAGAGKTATAVHWGHRARARFPDGQLYLDLRGYAPERPVPPADALAAFLTALLPGGAEIPLGTAERAARFRTEVTGRRLLVVLDNAASVDQVRMLLPGTGTCLVVVTSRDSLTGLVALHGAHRVAVGQLPQADAVALLRRLIGPRVDTEPEPAAALAERCVRLPLTLRLAAELAAFRPAVPLSGLVAELAQHTLDLLSSGDDQHAVVRAVFSWSLRQLSEEATRAFTALGRWPAPTFDAHGLAALACQPLETARALLDTLVRAHLVQPAGTGRYVMHDLLKAYAAETGKFDERAALGRVHAYYLATAAAAMDRLHPGEAHRRPPVPAAASPVPELPGPDEARDWLGAELATITALTAHAVAHGAPETAVTVSRLLFRYLDGQNDTVAIAIHDHARTAARTTGDREGEATALHALGGVHLQAGRADTAATYLWAAFHRYREIGDRAAQARALAAVGMVEERAGRHRLAIDRYTRALALLRHDSDLVATAHVLTRLGTTEARIDHGAAAMTHLDRAMALHRRAGHPFGQAWAKLGFAELALTRDHLSDALALHAEAVELFRTVGHRASEAWGVDGLGRTQTLRGHPGRAADHHHRALALFTAHGDRDGETWAHNGLGEACRAGGNPAAARVHHATALRLAVRTGAHEQAARAHHGLARTAADTGDLPAAHRHYHRATTLYRDLALPAADVVTEEQAALR